MVLYGKDWQQYGKEPYQKELFSVLINWLCFAVTFWGSYLYTEFEVLNTVCRVGCFIVTFNSSAFVLAQNVYWSFVLF